MFTQLVFKSEYYPVLIREVLCRVGDKVKKDDNIVLYEYDLPVMKCITEDPFGPMKQVGVKTMFDYFKARTDGVIHDVSIKEDDIIEYPEHPAFTLKVDCNHSIIFHGMCGHCGKDINDLDLDLQYTDEFIPVSHDSNELRISLHKAKEEGKKHMIDLLTRKRLILILDLDQTVIQANTNPIIGEYMKEENNPNYEALKDIKTFQLSPPDPNTYYIKPRPGLSDFLNSLYRRYEIHVYTMGTRNYAEQVCNVIDPNKIYFGDRIISRDESGSDKKKTIERLFPVGKSMVVVVDDRYDVWDWVPNIVRIWPYDFFGNGDINGEQFKNTPVLKTETKNPRIIEPGQEDNNNNKDQKENSSMFVDNDDHLKYTLKTILKVHKEFYKNHELNIADALAYLNSNQEARALPDVATILTGLRNNVFKNCFIMFSGMFPLGNSYQKDETIRLAQFYGAEYVESFTSHVTHLVANKPNTEKVKTALMRNEVSIIKIEWFYDCIKKWKHLKEFKYKLEGLPNNSSPMVTSKKFKSPNTAENKLLTTASADGNFIPTTPEFYKDQDEMREGLAPLTDNNASYEDIESDATSVLTSLVSEYDPDEYDDGEYEESDEEEEEEGEEVNGEEEGAEINEEDLELDDERELEEEDSNENIIEALLDSESYNSYHQNSDPEHYDEENELYSNKRERPLPDSEVRPTKKSISNSQENGSLESQEEEEEEDNPYKDIAFGLDEFDISELNDPELNNNNSSNLDLDLYNDVDENMEFIMANNNNLNDTNLAMENINDGNLNMNDLNNMNNVFDPNQMNLDINTINNVFDPNSINLNMENMFQQNETNLNLEGIYDPNIVELFSLNENELSDNIIEENKANIIQENLSLENTLNKDLIIDNDNLNNNQRQIKLEENSTNTNTNNTSLNLQNDNNPNGNSSSPTKNKNEIEEDNMNVNVWI
ncbi:hypothetical protein K502DRAFT_347154 [Neoconidiobolus thromboides FSU 785]|nr:hypothetical protein K502DRAFT_347154 [Neoconidiobolus thromboides FSU 785]